MRVGATAEPVEAMEPHQRAEAPWSWIATVDHKRIGILYLLTAFGFFLLAGLASLAMRLQLAVPNAALLHPEVYNEFFSLHGLIMIFLAIMPALIGFGNYLVPLMIGARDVAFPRLNAFSYWLFLFGGLLLLFSFFDGGAPNDGWTAYPPVSLRPYTSNPGMDYWSLALLVAGIGSIVGSVNLVVTIVTMRAPGMSLWRMPLFVWTILITAFLILWALPTLTAAAIMLFTDRNFGTWFFKPERGGDPVLYQHLFWWLGHPEVYIMILPVFGIMSEVVPVFSRKPLFGYPFMVGSVIAVGVYSFLVWAHHMFTVGLSYFELAFFSGASFLIAVPTGIKLFSWLATMWGGAIRASTAMLFAMGLIGVFVVGGVTGVAVAVVPFDWQAHDSYFVVAHLHYVLVGGSLLGIFAGAYYWFPKMTGRLLSERLGKWHFWLTLIGVNATFFPMHQMGLLGLPRRVYTYPAYSIVAELNLLATIGAVLQAAGILLFIGNVWWALARGPRAGRNPWDGYTLEWSVPSPPPPENFAEIPRVRGHRPLWEEREARGGRRNTGDAR